VSCLGERPVRENAVEPVRANARAGRLHAWMLTCALLAVVGLVAACGASRSTAGSARPASGAQPVSATSPHAVPRPVVCQQWRCEARQTHDLSDGLKVTLWLGGDQQNYQSRPIVELTDRNVAVQWWIAPQGDGWNGSLTCGTGASVPHCVLIDSLGMHASVAEVVMLHGGRLVHPVAAQAIANSAGMSAADLDGDGYLDVIGSTNDYKPSYAQGHNFWKTFRFSGDGLVPTGCEAQPRGAPAPTHLLTGRCPVV
jgi:hypothetical protein